MIRENGVRALLRVALAALLCACTLFAAPEASAVCSAEGDDDSDEVRFRNCTAGQSSGASDSFLDIAYPSSTGNGHVLVLAVVVKNQVGFYIPNGWVRIFEQAGDGSTMAIYRRIANGSESGDLRVSWTGNFHGQAIMLRLVNATGRFEVNWDASAGVKSDILAPDVTSGFDKQLVLRVAGFPGDRERSDGETTSIDGHKNLTWHTNPTLGTSPTNAITMAAAYELQSSVGATGTAQFNTGSSVAVTATVAFEYSSSTTTGPPTGAAGSVECPRDVIDPKMETSQVVEFVGCKVRPLAHNSGATRIRLNKPNKTEEGDLLIAMIVARTDNDEVARPAGWSRILRSVHKPDSSDEVNDGGSYFIYTKTATNSEPDRYLFDYTDVRGMAGIISAYRNASETVTVSSRIETGEGMFTPSVSTTVPNSLVIRTIAADDQDMTSNPAEIIPYYRNISTFDSQSVDRGVSLQAAYINVPSAGALRDERMYNLQDEESTLATLVIGPKVNYQLRFSMTGTTSESCGNKQVTLTVTDAAGATLTNFTGTVNLSVQAESSGDYAGASWRDLDGSLYGTLNNGSNGVASYTFHTGDDGVAVFDFQNPNAGTVNFNASYLDPELGSEVRESASHDPNLSISACRARIVYTDSVRDGTTCAFETVEITLYDSSGNRVTDFTGNLAIEASSNKGTWSRISGAGTFADLTANDGDFSYTFANADNGRATFSFRTTDAGTVNFDVKGAFVDYRDSSSAHDPNLVVRDCMVALDFGATIFSSSNGTCETQDVRVSVRSQVWGDVISHFEGSVTLSSASSRGDWSAAEVLTNSVVNGTANDGAATYQFAAADGGMVLLGFNQQEVATSFALNASAVSSITGKAIGRGSSAPVSIAFDRCVARIAFTDSVREGSTCAFETVEISLVDTDGNAVTDYTGDITVSSSTNVGNWSALTAAGTLSDATANDGAFVYTFATSDAGKATFKYTTTQAGTVNFNVSGSYIDLRDSTSIYDPNLIVRDCIVRVDFGTGTGTVPFDGNMCSIEDVRITIRNSVLGDIIPHFEGALTLSADSGNGDWRANETLANTVVNGTEDDGAMTYQIGAADEGNFHLGFTHLYENAGIRFNASAVSDSTGKLVEEASSADEVLVILPCSVHIAVDDGLASACGNGEQVTYTIRDSSGNVANNFEGYLLLDSETGKGDFSVSSASGELNNSVLNDGAALYKFELGDAGVLVANYTTNLPGTVSLMSSAPSINLDPASTRVIEFSSCELRISFPDGSPGVAESCSEELVRIGLYDAAGTAITDYAGAITVTSSTGLGDWSLDDGDGEFIDLAAADGSFVYDFASSDSGVATFGYTAGVAGSVNFDVDDGVITDARDSSDPNDPSLEVSACGFQISFDGGGASSFHLPATVTACSVQQVTIEVTSAAGELLTDYAGLVRITNTSRRGSWSVRDADGTLTALGVDKGSATYQFVSSDNGKITLDLSGMVLGSLSIDVTDGEMVVDSDADPLLTVTGCVPTIGTPSCSGPPDKAADLAITGRQSDPRQRGRLVVMLVADASDSEVSGATFDGVPMTRIHRAVKSPSAGAMLEMWGILDADLPINAGSYSAAYTGASADAAMCAMFLDSVEQAFPLYDSATPTAGAVNGATGSASAATTTLTTPAHNSLVVTGVVGGQSDGSSTDYGTLTPSALSRLFQGPDPTSADFAGTTGEIANAGELTVVDTRNGSSSDRYAQVAAAFAPLFDSEPIITDYVPLTLQASYAGQVGFNFFGSTLRTSDLAGERCEMKTEAATASLSFSSSPLSYGSSEIVAAWLYWFGAGDYSAQPAGADFDTVTFIDPDGTRTSIDAGGLHRTFNSFDSAGKHYYTAYKDVKSLMTRRGVYAIEGIDTDTSATYSSEDLCTAGWAMVVVHTHPQVQHSVVNVYDGLHPIGGTGGTDIATVNMSNFVTSTPSSTHQLPNGHIGFAVMEGDIGISDGKESYLIQATPGSDDFNILTNYYNLNYAALNSTLVEPVYRPMFSLPDGSKVFSFSTFTGQDGYVVADGGPFTGANPGPFDETGSAYGLDIDGFNLSATGAGEIGDLLGSGSAAIDKGLNAFGSVNATSIRTGVATGSDKALLFAQAFAITSEEIADLEITLAERAPFKVGGTGIYDIVVRNNGNVGTDFGSATGVVTVTSTLPDGLTLASGASVSGDGWSCLVTRTPSAFTCEFDIAASWNSARGAQVSGELGESSTSGVGENLPTLSAEVIIAGATTFPLLNNSVLTVARLLHSDGTCAAASLGVSPDPAGCAPPEFDNVNFLNDGAISINDLSEKTSRNNNVDSAETDIAGASVDLKVEVRLEEALNKSIGTSYYSLLVTNLGSTDTSAPFTVTVAKPPGISFSELSGAGFSGCTIATSTATCTYSAGAGLSVGATARLNVLVNVTGAIADVVVTTAAVTTGDGDFDPDLSNNTASNTASIVGIEPITQDRFLMSIGTLRPGTGIRGQTKLSNLASFNDDDLVLYDPVTDTASLFFDDSNGTDEIELNNIVAAHILPNGHLVLAPSGGSTATGVGAFGPNDLIKYDPIAQTSEMLFDGSVRLPGEDFRITGVHMLEDGKLLLTGLGDITYTDATLGSVSWQNGDIIKYFPATDFYSVFVDGERAELFGTDETPSLEGLYFRVSDTDPNDISDVFNFSTYEFFSRVGVGGEPPLGTVVTADDIGQIDVQTPSDTSYSTRNVFRGDANPGIFENATGSIDKDGVRWIDAVHVVEDGYIGHFSIAQSAAGSTCEVGKVIISKHEGRTHDIDADYYGSVIITTSTGTGDWGLIDGEGTLVNGTPGDGYAVYTFVEADGGDVELSLQVTTAAPALDIHVTNGIAEEGSTEDPLFSFNATTTTFRYLDNFSTAAFTNNSGSAGFYGAWFEVDDANGVSGANSGAGASAGNVQVGSGVLSLKSSSMAASGRDPSVARSVNFSEFTVTEAINLNFDYGYVGANAADAVVVEASDDGGANWQLLQTLTGNTGSIAGVAAPTIRLDTFGGSLNDFSATLSVRFRVSNGFTSGGSFLLDNVEITAGTTDCSVVSMDHYAISHDGTGISCLGSDITIMGHDASHNLIAVPLGEVMALSNNRLKGTWASVLSGSGVLTDVGAPGSAANTDGQASYAWSGSDHTTVLRFNYTNPGSDPETLNFDLSGSYFEDKLTAAHDDDLSISQAGLRFYDVTNAAVGIPTQLSGKPSNVGFGAAALQLQAVRSSDDDPSACVALFPDAEVVEIDFAVECTNPSNCASTAPAQSFVVNGTSLGAALQNTDGGAGASTYRTLSSTFEDAAVGTAVPIVLSYSDAGRMQLHARYNIPFDEDVDGVVSGDYLEGSTSFVVRPFGFDIDFDDDRSAGTNASRAADASAAVYRKAGSSFETTLTAQRWQAADDLNSDGVPDADADLSDNGVTPNFGNESGSEEDDVVVSHSLDLPVAAKGSREGTLTGGSLFSEFTGAVSTANLSYSEVGVIDLAAGLADADYLGSGQDVRGNVQNVGRFIPDHFTLASTSVSAMCTPANDFTYMGEPFPVSFMLEARNASGAVTENYIGDFVKLVAGHFAPDSVFHGVQDIAGAADVDRSLRTESIDSTFSVSFDDFGDPAPGVGSVLGRLVFNRENDGVGVDGAPDGPFTLRIGTSVADSDGVAIKMSSGDIDLDDGVTEPGSPAFAELTSMPIQFRYGRLLLENSFGPETEDLEIPVQIQYFDGTEFLLNSDDSCTTLTFNVSTPPLAIVSGSIKSPSGTANPLEAGDTTIEQGVVENFTITLSGGRTGDTNILSTGSDSDRPFSASAPLGGAVGSAIVELDLGYSSANDPVDFLTYDWRGGSGSTDPYAQEIPDGSDYTDNPRAIIEFGSYRSHDRVLSWRELYVMPPE